MLPILYRPMVKEALVLITSGIVATMICSRVYAATASDAEQNTQSAQTAAAPASTQHQLAPVPQDQAREMLLAAIRGQTPLAGAPGAGR
jgi:hypothetical protein